MEVEPLVTFELGADFGMLVRGVVVVDAKTGTFTKQIPATPAFKGFSGSNATSGPNGVVAAYPWLFVTDASSRVVTIDLRTATEVEVKERKDLVDDAMHATRAAVEEGVVPGGGAALLYAIKALDKLTPANPDQKVGIEIVRKAIQWPARQIAENSGADGSIIVGKLLESKDANYGYDAQKGEFTDMIKAGILDPTKVVRHALQDAASVAGLLVTTEAMVAERPEPKPAMPAMPPGGGMGGMDF